MVNATRQSGWAEAVPIYGLAYRSVDWYVLFVGTQPNGRTQKLWPMRRLADRSADLPILPVGRNI
jgi:hypothetical protein